MSEMTLEEALSMVDGGPHHIGEWAQAATILSAEVRRLQAENARLRPEAEHIIDENAVKRRVLGTLPLTADGCVVGHKAYLWNTFPGVKGRDDDKPMRVCYKPCPIMDPDAYTDGPMRMWSTREAAEKVANQ